MALATIADLEAVLRKSIDPNDTEALSAINVASAMVEAYLGMRVELVEGEIITMDGNGHGVLLLPEYPVVSVNSIEEDGENLIEGDDYEWSETGQLRRLGRRWTKKLRAIDIDYDHGYGTVPTAITGVVAAVAARAYDTPVTVRQESIGNYSVTYGGTPGVTLQAMETITLDRYKRL